MKLEQQFKKEKRKEFNSIIEELRIKHYYNDVDLSKILGINRVTISWMRLKEDYPISMKKLREPLENARNLLLEKNKEEEGKTK